MVRHENLTIRPFLSPPFFGEGENRVVCFRIYCSVLVCSDLSMNFSNESGLYALYVLCIYVKKVSTVMVNNSTKIDNTDNFLSPQIIGRPSKNATTHANEIPGSCLGHAPQCDLVKLVNGIPTIPS